MEDFDVAQLASYLHLTPDQINRMVERGRLPGRKVQGNWRFSKAEIHHWLEDRIGASDPEQLGAVERVLSRSPGQDSSTWRVVGLIPTECIAVPFNARTQGSVIRQMAELATRNGMLWDAQAMAEAVRYREELHPTALDCGVALLHPRRPQSSILSDSVIALGICPAPLPFSDQGHATDLFFLVCSYNDRAHLRILARLSRIIGNAEVLDQLRQSDSPAEAKATLTDAENQILDSME